MTEDGEGNLQALLTDDSPQRISELVEQLATPLLPLAQQRARCVDELIQPGAVRVGHQPAEMQAVQSRDGSSKRGRQSDCGARAQNRRTFASRKRS